MAFAIASYAKASGPVTFQFPAAHFEIADQTATTSVTAGGQGDNGTALRWFRSLIYLKTFTAGTTETVFRIEVADNAAMTTNLRLLREFVVQATAGVRGILLDWTPVPDAAKQFVRVAVTFGTGASGTFDAMIDAV